MNKKSKRSLKAAELENHPLMRELYHRAEAQLRKQRHTKSSAAPVPRWPTGPERLLHELQVHEIELELQNSELRQARDKLEVALENYTDLYDFAPVGYFTLAASGAIHRANLTGASLVGIERSRLVNRPFGQLVPAALRPAFNAFLKKVFASPAKQSLDVEILRPGQPSLAVNIEAQRLLNGEECRAAVMDITERKQAGVAQRRVEVLAASNHKLELEIVRRHAVEVSLKQSEQHQLRLLAESQRMQEQLRNLSRQVLLAQEDERKRISRELHDVIAQTLTGINLRLATLKIKAGRNTKGFGRNISRTQQLVEKSVNIVHDFARELRPAVLDDLGLIPALHSFVKTFSQRTGLHIKVKVFAGVETLGAEQRTTLYRVAQEALTNVERHAQASRVEVSIQQLPAGVCMKIKDDGKSFEMKRAAPRNGGKRLGLLGMRERMEIIGGRFEIESAPGQGTTVRVDIPLTRPHGGH